MIRKLGDTGDGYPNGTVYFCNFSGKFTEPLRFDKCMYEMDLEELETEGIEGESYIENGVRYVYSEPYGISGGTQFTLYTPGQPYEMVSEDFAWWVRSSSGSQETDYLTCYAICNAATQDGFVGYENQEGEDREDEYIFAQSDHEYLNEQDIIGKSKETIQQAINEIYARHGRVFQKSDVAAYFASKSWYYPIQGKTDDQIVAEFNSYEKANVDFLAKYL
ncbi:MAG: YARHG domain-containing protein [Lachnospiraceae bacterium]